MTTSSYEQKLADARKLITEHNARMLELHGPKIDADKFFQNLKLEGAHDAISLATFTWEEIREHGVTPRAIAKLIEHIFKQTDKVPSVKDDTSTFENEYTALMKLTSSELGQLAFELGVSNHLPGAHASHSDRGRGLIEYMNEAGRMEELESALGLRPRAPKLG